MAEGKAPSKDNYTAADSLIWLEGLEGVRKRPGMYIGSVDTRGLTHCLYEILDNSVDEALAGHASEITIIAHSDGSFEVSDNGRGIPVDIEPRSGLPGVVLVMTKLHAGGKFGGDGYKVSGGLHGVGASVVNALSDRVDVTVRRDRKRHDISFRRGEPGSFAGDGPHAKFKPTTKLTSNGKAVASDYGTTVRFWPDTAIFTEDAVVDMDKVRERCLTTAHLVDVKVTLVVETDGTSEEFYAPEGISALVAEGLGSSDYQVWRCQGHGTFISKDQVVNENGELETTDVEKEITVDVSLGWNIKSFDYMPRSFANVVSTPGGGTHLKGAEQAVTKAVQGALGSTNLIRANEESPVKDDILSGLVIVVAIQVPEPEFEGQTKEILSTSAVTKIVNNVVSSGLEPLFGAKRMRPAVRAVCETAVANARLRRNAKAQRENARKSRQVISGPLPAKLRDCRKRDGRSELFIVEGDSAAGSVGAARDSLFQAYLPIRGKILNTMKASVKQMLENTECGSIAAAIGGGTGESFNLDAMRYGKISLLVDADVDGSHIRCLLLAFFWKHMRPMIEAGRVYASAPPLYRISTADGVHHYAYTDQHRDEILSDLKKRKVKVLDGIQRFKGLGEMDPEQLAETALEEGTRHERQITMADAGRAEEMFERLMGNDTTMRREWLLAHAGDLDLEDIDL